MRALVTRPAEQAREWIEALASRGVDAVALPLIGIAPPVDADAVLDVWRRLDGFALVVFVSPNAVDRFFAQRPVDRVWPNMTYAASIGPGTTRALLGRGVERAAIVEPRVDAAQWDSEALWAALSARSWRGAGVLIVRGLGGRDWLAERLRDDGARVEHVAAYRRVAPSLDAAGQGLLAAARAAPRRHVWLFSSSEAISNLLAIAGDPAGGAGARVWPQARAIATHPRIAERAKSAGFARVEAAAPQLDAVVGCIQSFEP